MVELRPCGAFYKHLKVSQRDQKGQAMLTQSIQNMKNVELSAGQVLKIFPGLTKSRLMKLAELGVIHPTGEGGRGTVRSYDYKTLIELGVWKVMFSHHNNHDLARAVLDRFRNKEPHLFGGVVVNIAPVLNQDDYPEVAAAGGAYFDLYPMSHRDFAQWAGGGKDIPCANNIVAVHHFTWLDLQEIRAQIDNSIQFLS